MEDGSVSFPRVENELKNQSRVLRKSRKHFDHEGNVLPQPGIAGNRGGIHRMIVITGASGLVGGNLVRALLSQGCPVRALVHHDHRALAGLDVETASADLNDLASLEQAFRGAQSFYHLASTISIRMDNWDELERVNVNGTRNVVEACLRCGVRRLVYFSSIHAYQREPFDRPWTKDGLYSPMIASRPTSAPKPPLN